LPSGLIEPDMTAWMGPCGTVVHYYVRRGEIVNWIAHYETDWREESWSVESDWREAAAAFAGWHPSLAQLFSRTERCYKWALYDRDPLPRWTHGRVTLLGDAAHPMYPVGSNGASQAILDARCLADRLAGAEHPRQALAAYEAERLPMTAEIVRSNRKGGPEGVIDAVEALAPDGFDDIEKVLPYAKREAIVRGYAQKAGFAKEQVKAA